MARPPRPPGTMAAAHFTSLDVSTVCSIRPDSRSPDASISGLSNAAAATFSDAEMAVVSVSSISLRWGFQTPSHVGRAFKDSFGLTPAQYRNQALGG